MTSFKPLNVGRIYLHARRWRCCVSWMTRLIFTHAMRSKIRLIYLALQHLEICQYIIQHCQCRPPKHEDIEMPILSLPRIREDISSGRREHSSCGKCSTGQIDFEQHKMVMIDFVKLQNVGGSARLQTINTGGVAIDCNKVSKIVRYCRKFNIC